MACFIEKKCDLEVMSLPLIVSVFNLVKVKVNWQRSHNVFIRYLSLNSVISSAARSTQTFISGRPNNQNTGGSQLLWPGLSSRLILKKGRSFEEENVDVLERRSS